MTKDPLENELGGMKPLPLSSGFMAQFEAALEDQRTAPTLAWPWRRRLVIGLTVAACIAVAATALYRILSVYSSQPITVPKVVLVDSRPFPTIAQYQQAYMESPAALEALLQQRSSKAPEQPPMRAGDVIQFNLN